MYFENKKYFNKKIKISQLEGVLKTLRLKCLYYNKYFYN